MRKNLPTYLLTRLIARQSNTLLVLFGLSRDGTQPVFETVIMHVTPSAFDQ